MDSTSLSARSSQVVTTYPNTANAATRIAAAVNARVGGSWRARPHAQLEGRTVAELQRLRYAGNERVPRVSNQVDDSIRALVIRSERLALSLLLIKPSHATIA